MSDDRPTLGILLMLAFCVIAPLADAMAKLVGDSVGLGFLVTIRMLVQAAILLPLLRLMDVGLGLSRRALRLSAARALLHVSGIATMFLSLRYLPLADAIAIAYVMPFIMLALGHFVLGEHVGHRRILASLVGFAGTLMVMQPSFAEVGWPAGLPVVVAVIFALFMLVTRQLAKEADPVALQAVSGLMSLALLVPALAVGTLLSFEEMSLELPGAGSWVLLVEMGVLGTVAHLAMTWALRFAPSATLAPMQYLEIPVAATLGWLIFDDFPDGLALMGIVVTIAAGLYIILREQKVARSALSGRRPAPPSAG